MDFGVVSHKQTSPNALFLGESARDERGHGSVNLKHQRSVLIDDYSKPHKMPKPARVGFSSNMLTADTFATFGRSNLWPPSVVAAAGDDGQKMLSFSSPAPHCGASAAGPGRSIVFSICHDETRPAGGISRLKGPFTPSQWMELEHQALIYKHIVANVPVPSNLLVPLKRSLYSDGSYASNFLGWGPFHLGFSSSNDPEPGRCRRTDGKKWRCSRDAVPDQKYCERHINRGRHRSRKPVEGHTGHGSAASKVTPPIASSSSASVISTSSASNTLAAMQQHQLDSLQSNAPHHLVSRSQEHMVDVKPKDAPFSIHKQHAPFEESSKSEFGIVSSDCLLNPSNKISYISGSTSDSLIKFDAKEVSSTHPVHHFIDDWPKDESEQAPGSWPEELKSDWTQLSMSIPITQDFSSSSGSPQQEKSTLPTLRLSHKLDHSMSLGVSHDLCQAVEKQSPWCPIIWGNSMGGPLGEVLSSSSNGVSAGAGSAMDAVTSFSSKKAFKRSPKLGSSPTAVLQKSTFVSLSNSSSAGSPNHTNADQNKALCNDLLGSTLITSATIPQVI